MNQLMNLSKPWKSALPGFFFVLLAILLLYRQTGLAMVEIWERSETFAHAFVVPPIALWLIWRQRAHLADLHPQPAPWFLLPLAACALLWLVGELAAVNAATQLAFTAMLVLAVPLTLGTSVAGAIAFPLGFLFFAVPIGEFLIPQFMDWTADFTVLALRMTGIPVYREGLQFVIPSGNWSVVEACSGIRYLMASVMVGTLFAYLNYRSLKRRWIFIGFSVLLPIVANWLRAYLTVLLGHFSGNKLATGADHLVYGWVFFGIIMLAMFMVGARWSEPDAEPQPPAGPGLSPVRQTSFAINSALALALLVMPLLGLHQLDQAKRLDSPTLLAPDLSAKAWRLDELAAPRLAPAFVAPAAQMQAQFRGTAEAAKVGVFIGFYRNQSYKSKLISSGNDLLASEDAAWSKVDQGRRSLDVDGLALPLRTTVLREAGLRGDGRRLLVWQVYWINGRAISSDWQAKLAGALYRLLGRGDDAAVLVFYAEEGEGGAGEKLLASFVQGNWSSFDALLRQARDSNSAPAH
jgi:exosortase A